MKEPVLQSRITPPRQPGNIIQRQSLVEALNSNRDKKVILLTAPAGYGKTTLTCEFLYSSNKKFAWLHLSKDINSPFTFFSYIIHSVARLKEGFGSLILETISSLKKDSANIREINSVIDEIVLLFTNEFYSSFKEDTYLILDDLHEISEQKWFEYLLDSLVRELPQNLQLIITSRHNPEFNISHLRAKREILEIGYKDLTLSHREIKTLAGEIYSKDFTEEESKYLETSLGGWVTGIHLLIQAAGDKIKIDKFTDKFIPDTIFDYLANEIFSGQSKSVQDFLLTTAHLENFTSELCDYIINDNTKNTSEEILNYLSGKNIFIENIQVVDSSGNIFYQYNYVHLFKNFLINKFDKTLTKSAKAEIFDKISSYYLIHKDIENSIEFSLMAGDNHKVQELILENFEHFVAEGKLEKLWQWTELLGEDIVSQNNGLLYLKGILSKFYLGDLNKASDYMERSISLSESAGHTEFLNKALISKTGLLLDMGKFGAALEILEKLHSQDNSVLNSAKINYNLGYVYFFTGDFARAINFLETAAEICKENNFDDLLGDIYNVLGNIYITSGEFVLSTHYYELALNKVTGIFKRFSTLGNLTILYNRSAKFTKAKEYYDRTLELYKLVKTPIFEIVTKLAEFTLYSETGDYETALKIADTINKTALKIKNVGYTFLSYQLLGECNYFLGNIDKSDSYGKLTEEYTDKENENDNITLSLFRQLNKLTASHTQDIGDELHKIYDYLTKVGSNYDKVTCGYYLAYYYYLNNQPSSAEKYLRETITFAKEKEYNSFLIREYLRSGTLFSFAFKNNIEKDVIKEIYSNVSAIPELAWIKDEYRVKLTHKITGLYDIRMSTFGKLEFFVRGKAIDDKKWIRKKRKLVLAYLLLSNSHSITKDKLIDIFFPDTPAESLDNTFHQVISNLRTALKHEEKTGPGRKKSQKDNNEPDYIIYEDKVLRLNPDYNYYTDTSEFEKLINSAFSAETDGKDRLSQLKQAAELYKGDFLEEYYEPWIEDIRDELKNKFIKCCETLIKQLSENNDNGSITKYCSMILKSDKLNETANLYLLKADIASGKISQAKAMYNKITKIYDEELGEKPPKSIIEIARNLTG